MIRSSFVVALAGAFAFAAPSAHGQTGSGGTISQGNAFFTQGVSPTTATGTGAAGANLRATGAAGTDHAFQHWWWYRVNGTDTREFCFANASAWNWAGNTGTLNYSLPSFSAVVRYVVTEPAAGQARVDAEVQITNTSGATLSLDLFSYLDFDLNATAGSDSATLQSPSTMVITEGATAAYFRGVNASAYQVTTFAAVRTLLSDAVISNLNNSGLPFGPADWTGAWQFTRSIPAGNTVTVRSVFGIGAPPPDCIRDFNSSGSVTTQDLYDYLTDWSSQSAGGPIVIASADTNNSGTITVQDLYDYLSIWLNGCP